MPSLAAIQILRGIAAWLVVYHHYLQIFYHLESHSPLGRFFSHYGLIGVDIFFIISGFVMTYSLTLKPRTARIFWLGRVKRIVPLYWFYTLLALLAVESFSTQTPYTWSTLSLLKSLLFIPHNNPAGIGFFPFLMTGWTLTYEMFFYSLLALNLYLCKRFYSVLTALLCCLLPFYWPSQGPLAEFFSSSRLTEFSFGMLLAYLYLHTSLFSRCKTMISGLVLLSLLAIHAHQQRFIFLEAVALVLVYAGLGIEKQLNPQHGLLKKLISLGEISYSTYLSHYILIFIAHQIIMGPLTTAQEAVLIASLSLSTLGISFLSHHFLEKNRFLYQAKVTAI